MRRIRSAARGGALALATALLLLLAPVAASASPLGEASDWLVSQLQPTPASDPAVCESFSAAATVGQTIDCMLAFEAAGAAYDDERDATYAAVLADFEDYVGADPCPEASSLSAGSVAKLALALLSQGDDPRNLAGRDLIADLQCLQVDEGPQAGRFADKGASDFSNAFGQSLALLAFASCEASCAGEPDLSAEIAAGAAYLRGQQCQESVPASLDGAFRSPLGRAADECNDEPPFGGQGFNLDAVDVDSSGAAVQGLLAAGPESEAAATAALEWLEAEEQVSGSPPLGHWRAYCDFLEPEALSASVNSTAAAAMAMSASGSGAGRAQAWLAGVVEAGETGGMPACGAAGPPDVLATAQGTIALAGSSYLQLAGL